MERRWVAKHYNINPVPKQSLVGYNILNFMFDSVRIIYFSTHAGQYVSIDNNTKTKTQMPYRTRQ